MPPHRPVATPSHQQTSACIPGHSAARIRCFGGRHPKAGAGRPGRCVARLIIDGRHRFYACLVAGVMPVFNNLPTDVNPFIHVRTKNDLRRHISPNDRAETAYMVWAMEREGFPNMPEGTANDFAILQNDWDKSRLEDVAAEAGVSPRLVSYVASVRREGSTASPELRAAAERKIGHVQRCV